MSDRVDAFEQFMNELSDQDWGWWPFLRLRPAKSERITLGRLVRMAVAYGAVYGTLCGAFFAILGRITFPSILPVAIAFVPIFFVAYGLTFVPMWNRRARRLSREGTER